MTVLGIEPMDLDIVILAAVHSNSIAQKLAEWLDGEHLYEAGGYAWQFCIWDVVKEQVLSRGKLPNWQFMTMRAKSIAEQHYPPGVADEVGQAMEAMKDAEAPAEEVDRVIKLLYDHFVKDPTLEKEYILARTSGDWDRMRARILELNAPSASGSIDDQVSDLFSILDRLDIPVEEDDTVVAEDTSRIETGTVLDILHDGRGLYCGFVSLFLGPTSGGKTIMAMDLIARLTATGRKVAFFPTEENLESHPEAMSRLYAAVTGIKVSDWTAAKNDPRRLPPGVFTEEHKKFMIKCRENLYAFRFNEDLSWSSLEAQLRDFESEHGNMPDFIILDWAGPLARHMVQSGECRDEHIALEQVMLNAQSVTRMHPSVGFVVFHQLAADSCDKKGIFGSYHETDSQNCKKMAQHAAACYIITPRDEGKTERARLIGPKLRYDVKGREIIVEMDYQRSRFRHMEFWEAKNRSFVDSRSGSSSGFRMPNSVRNAS